MFAVCVKNEKYYIHIYIYKEVCARKYVFFSRSPDTQGVELLASRF